MSIITFTHEQNFSTLSLNLTEKKVAITVKIDEDEKHELASNLRDLVKCMKQNIRYTLHGSVMDADFIQKTEFTSGKLHLTFHGKYTVTAEFLNSFQLVDDLDELSTTLDEYVENREHILSDF